jgi:outer membrane protein assembly factor BamB
VTPEETPFSPEEIDEQIDRLAQVLPSPQGVPASPDQQLIGDLRALYSAEAEALAQASARGRARLARSSPPAFSHPAGRQMSDQSRAAYERRYAMKDLRTRFVGEHSRLYRIGSLAAAVLLVVLVGGLAVGLVLVRHGGTNTVGPSNRTATATAPTPAANNIYITTSVQRGQVSKLDGKTGKVLWSYQTSSPILDTPVITEGVAAFSTQDDRIIGLDTRTGNVRWNINVDSGTAGNVQMTPDLGNLLYPSESGNGILYELSWAGAEVRQMQIVPSASAANPAYLSTVSYANGMIYGIAYPHFSNSPSSILYALDDSRGKVIWQTPIIVAEEFFNGPPIPFNGRVYVTSQEVSQHTGGESRDSYVFAFDAQTGRQLWQSQKMQAIWSAPAAANAAVYVNSAEGDGVYALNAATGNILWHIPGPGNMEAIQSPLVHDDIVYTEQPQVMALNAGDGSPRWQANTSGAFSLSDGLLYVLATSSVDVLRTSDGTQIGHFSLGAPGGFLGGVTIGP